MLLLAPANAVQYTITFGDGYTESFDNNLRRLQQASSVEIATAETKGQSQLL